MTDILADSQYLVESLLAWVRIIAGVGSAFSGVTSAANCRLAEGAQCLAGASQAMAQQCTIAPRTMAWESPTPGEGMTYLRSV